MILSFHPCFMADHQVILGDRELDSSDITLIEKSKVIILPQTCSNELYQQCQRSSAILFPNYNVRFIYPGKVGQSIMFKEKGLPHPHTRIWHTVDEFRRNYRKRYSHTIPFLLKDDKSHEGDGIFLINEEKDLEPALQMLSERHNSHLSPFVSQEHIPSRGDVLRVVILADRLVSYWKRSENPGKEICSVKKGAVIDKEWMPGLQKKGRVLARKVARRTGINLAAVDFIFPINRPDPEPVCLEINYYFGRRGLGGSIRYYSMLYNAIIEWIGKLGFDAKSIKLS